MSEPAPKFLVRIQDPDLKAIEYHPCDDEDQVSDLFAVPVAGDRDDPNFISVNDAFREWAARQTGPTWNHETFVLELVESDEDDEYLEFEVLRIG